MLNGINVSINEFPGKALVLYQEADSIAPNRSINTLGMARANVQLGNNDEAARLYQVLLTQVNLSTDSDPIFSQEAANFIVNYNSTTTGSTTAHYNSATTTTTTTNTISAGHYNSAATNKYFFLSSVLIFCIFYY
jgi:hypothetical protein